MDKNKAAEKFKDLLEIMDELREKCPWDQKQTLETLRHLTIEETFELSEAIVSQNMDEIRKELGDLLLHIVFYSKIASETAAFDITEVIEQICKKLIHRHPHIYGEVKVENEAQVRENWEKIKLKEGNSSVLGGVPKSLPAMIKAYRMQEKAASVGFDWDNYTDVFAKVKEELLEWEHEIEQAQTRKAEEEFGDLLFALINVARWKNINPEDALEKCNQKFKRRFEYIEQSLKNQSIDISEAGLEKMDELWNEAKKSGL